MGILFNLFVWVMLFFCAVAGLFLMTAFGYSQAKVQKVLEEEDYGLQLISRGNFNEL